MPPAFSLIEPVLRPLIRFACGFVAIPLFRFLLKRVFRVQTSDAEMERDLEQWFRGCILLLAATSNVESYFFGILQWHRLEDQWWTMLLRLLLAVGVIESMPDQDLFSIIHRGPPKVRITSKAGWGEAWKLRKEFLKGIFVLHLRRSSPVFAIMTVVFGAEKGNPLFEVGWWCYAAACGQYLIIALITNRDRIEGLLQAFDRGVSHIRAELEPGTETPGAGTAAVISSGPDAAPCRARRARD